MIGTRYTLQDTSLPVGAITAFAGEINTSGKSKAYTTPIEELGWMVCDGRKLETHRYPELFAALGTLYGGELAGGNSPSYFYLPNLQGMFLRGVGTDNASTESRTKASKGKDNGVGSTQDFALQKHVHVYTSPGTPVPTGLKPVKPAVPNINPKDTTAPPTESTVQGNVKVSKLETRPINIFVYYLIKFRY
jgi:microcystin-dependent protein